MHQQMQLLVQPDLHPEMLDLDLLKRCCHAAPTVFVFVCLRVAFINATLFFCKLTLMTSLWSPPPLGATTPLAAPLDRAIRRVSAVWQHLTGGLWSPRPDDAVPTRSLASWLWSPRPDDTVPTSSLAFTEATEASLPREVVESSASRGRLLLVTDHDTATKVTSPQCLAC